MNVKYRCFDSPKMLTEKKITQKKIKEKSRNFQNKTVTKDTRGQSLRSLSSLREKMI